MIGKRSTAKQKTSISVCYLIDVAPERFTGGGQIHLLNLIEQMKFQISDFRFKIFAALASNISSRFLWMLSVVPQVIFYHLSRQRLTLIHAHSIPAMVAGKILSVILGIPIVITIHGSILNIPNKDTPSRTGRSILYGFLERWILTGIKYDTQITVSRDFLKFPNVNKNVHYIPNGIDINVFKGPTLSPQGRTLSDKTVLFVGRKSDPVKGFSILEKAMRLVKQEIPDAKLLVADGSISKDVVLKMYQLADLFVLPSLSEGFPLTLLEAWAAKLPVVATKVGELPYLVKDGINGYLVEPGSTEKLTAAIVAALNNKQLAKIGENGYNLAKRYTWSSVARNTMKVYNEAVLNKMS